MGALDQDLAVRQIDDGRYAASVTRDWEMWGPLGGYLAALALRAISQESPFPRPVTLSCDFLDGGSFDEEAEIDVLPLRLGRAAAVHRAVIRQDRRPILEATAWSADIGEGPKHIDLDPPDLPAPLDTTAGRAEKLAWLPFIKNLQVRIPRPDTEDDPIGERDPRWQGWTAFQPVATFDDPWVDAARSVILLDVAGFAAAAMHHGTEGYMAPSLDLRVSFHGAAPPSEWLLIDAHAPVSGAGVLGWEGRVWTADGGLVATGSGQSLWKKL